uniref:BED-type domain-containing protein n=1 Tax=Salvator merianae TaxID=96440 RepID=A0A8D0E6C4_SALMN
MGQHRAWGGDGSDTQTEPAASGPSPAKRGHHGSPKGSIVWRHFELCPDAPNYAACNHCKAQVSRGQNVRSLGTTALWSHLKSQNPDVLPPTDSSRPSMPGSSPVGAVSTTWQTQLPEEWLQKLRGKWGGSFPADELPRWRECLVQAARRVQSERLGQAPESAAPVLSASPASSGGSSPVASISIRPSSAVSEASHKVCREFEVFSFSDMSLKWRKPITLNSAEQSILQGKWEARTRCHPSLGKASPNLAGFRSCCPEVSVCSTDICAEREGVLRGW